VTPYCGQDRTRFHISGAEVTLPPKHALALAMALHELCTNALKYGALANDKGHIEISWRLANQESSPRLLLRWEEIGGPPVKPPARRGFGSRLIERGLQQDLSGEVSIAFPRTGVICTIDAPIAGAGEVLAMKQHKFGTG
jgi:two-component sensor histidine kinase